ncbi:lysine-rich coiled-coil protein 1-like [Kogia breviceps]|uniref:lysine-rich coiled-coil protein 1-like n=1 Tax=Kogia breviceps TaxID=27615 RepID=UPI0027957CB6|nr:lysine-rich coiled-coil protein 1-like [Kogia breviceps]
MLEQRFPFRRPHKSPSSYKRPKTVESRLPTLSNIRHFRQRLEPVNHCQKKRDHFFNIRWFPSPPVQGMTTGPHTAQHREEASCFSEDHTSVHQAGDQDGGWTGRSREKGGGGHGGEDQVSWKRKHHRDEDDEDSHKGNRREARAAPGSTEKSKYRKKSAHDWDTMKEGRKSSREKKHPGKDSTQEGGLWDEAILGGCS